MVLHQQQKREGFILTGSHCRTFAEPGTNFAGTGFDYKKANCNKGDFTFEKLD